MLRSMASKVAWVGRTASMVFGLALVVALVFGAVSVGLAANGQPFILGKAKNTASKVTGLVSNVDGAAMQVVNNNADANDTALSLNVQAGEAPMRVNSTTKVGNLNSDKVDSYDSTTLLPGGDLPPGRTVRGYFEIDAYAHSAALVAGSDSISFGYRLASVPTMEFVREGAASTTNCPGTANSPEAAKGYLCIYESDKSNASLNYGNSTRVGVGLRLTSANAGHIWAYGTWAVTGPDPGITPL